MRLFQLLQSKLVESEDDEDPFADPNPIELEIYLAKLQAQAIRRNRYSNTYWHELRALSRNNELGSITGEDATVNDCFEEEDLSPGWTRIGDWQLSPGVMEDPRLQNVVDMIKTDEAVDVASGDLWRKIAWVQRQIKLAKKVQKGSS